MTAALAIDLAPWGYAPGNTFIYCTDCTNQFGQHPVLAHRHSTRCTEHALKARLDDIRAAEGFVTVDVEIAVANYWSRSIGTAILAGLLWLTILTLATPLIKAIT